VDIPKACHENKGRLVRKERNVKKKDGVSAKEERNGDIP